MRGLFIFYSVFIVLITCLGIAVETFYALKTKKQRSTNLHIVGGGYAAARTLLNSFKLFDINVARVRDGKKDYYDKRNKILFLTDEIYECDSVFAVSGALIASARAIIQKKKSSLFWIYSLEPIVEYLLKFVMPFSVLALILGFGNILASFAVVLVIFSLIIIFISLITSILHIISLQYAKKTVLAFLEQIRFKKQPNNSCLKFTVEADNNDCLVELKAAVQCPPPSLLILTLLSPVYFLPRKP